jgi:hypothetical protein
LLLAELISEATRKSLSDKGFELRVTGLSDFEGTTDFKGILSVGGYDAKLKKALSTKRSGGSFLERPWTVYLSPTEQFGHFVAESYSSGLVVIDMSHPFDLEKSSALLCIVKDLQVSLLCPLSRPPAFRDKCASVLGPRFKSFVKLPSVKRLVYAIVEAFEANPDRESVADPKLIAQILGLEEVEEDVVKIDELEMPLLDSPYAKTRRLSMEKRRVSFSSVLGKIPHLNEQRQRKSLMS